MDKLITEMKQSLQEEISETRNVIFGELNEMKKLLQNLKSVIDPAITIDEPEEEEERYKKLGLLGGGSEGIVYEVVDMVSGQTYAMKEVGIDNNLVPLGLVREISIMGGLRHENLVRLKEVVRGPESLRLIMEKMDNTLENIILNGETNDSKKWMRQLLFVVCHMHKNGLIHRDIKPSNILLDHDKNVKLADFGLARGFLDEGKLTSQVTTPVYRAPEMLLGGSYGKAVDLWGVGCVFYELVEKERLVGSANSDMETMYNILSKLGTPDSSCWLCNLTTFPKILNHPKPSIISGLLDELGNDLMMRLLSVDPDQRITAEDALKHPYFDEE